MFKFHQETLVKNNWKCHFYKATYRNVSSQDVSKSTYFNPNTDMYSISRIIFDFQVIKDLLSGIKIYLS